MSTAKLLKLEKLVTEILENSTAARNDDYILYKKVCERLYKTSLEMPLCEVLTNHKELLPNWESVSRVRRKVQERRKDLLGDKRTRQKRKEREADYIGYART